MMIAEGAGGPKDEARAIELIRKACKGGESQACSVLQSTP
jgi:TPR repeat protein